MAMASGAGSPCGACKFLHRRCVADCVFAPYFCSDHGPARFAAVHKVFGASNVSKLLLQLPVEERFAAVVTITYEAQARLEDPIFGCVSHIVALRQQVINLQAEVMQARTLQAQYLYNSINAGNQWASTMVGGTAPFSTAYMNVTNYSWAQNSLYSVDPYNGGGFWQQEVVLVTFPTDEGSSMSRASPQDVSELQALAHRMTKTKPKF